ncbi:MAG: lysoplasmalogenase [Clostridia bacterium]|nr:lysoplasmalogenase [Clostridia bacterium]
MKKYLTLQNILNLVLALGIIAGDVFYITGGKLMVKTITSAGFFLIGLINLFYSFKQNKKNMKFAMIMTVGLFFAMLGDILLGMEFIVGAIFFAIGHVFYFVAYCNLVKFKWVDLIAGGVLSLAAVLIICLLPIIVFEALVMQILVCFYAVLISFMLGKALTNLIRERNLLNALILIGSILFFFSDLMLLFYKFTSLPLETRLIFDALCLGTYYPAEIILAMTIFFLPQQKSEEKN